MGAVAAGAFLLFAIPAAIVLMRGKAHDADAPTDGGAMVVELPKVERNAADAIILFERGEVEAGKAKLAKSKTPYEAPEVQRAVAIGAFSQGRNVEAIQALTLLAQKKPDEVVGETFLPLVKTAAAAEPSSEAAMKLLEEHPNERVTDALYTLSIPPNARPVMDRADKALRNPLVRAKASKALEVALSLKDAGQDCNAVQYFDDAAKFVYATAEIFDPVTHAFTHFSDVRVDSLAFSDQGELWGTSWPARGDVLTYVAPVLVVDVEHLGRAANGLLRQPSVVRLRPDLSYADVVEGA